jgi:glycosyltransferase involved in cell wall biosynthesis
VKLACVVHRFGAGLAGGSEGHCRAIAQHLAADHDVTVVTTCAKDHVTWRNHFPAGESTDGRLRVVRFPVVRQRNLLRFREISDVVFADRAGADEQEQWFRENGPEAPALVDFLDRRGPDFDLVLFWAYRYYHSYFGVPRVGRRAVLVPTAEADPLIHVDAVKRLFALPGGYIFLTPEEAALLERLVPPGTPSCIVGIGVDPPPATGIPSSPRNERLAPPVEEPFLLYLGRVDPNKGCETLLRYFQQFADEDRRGVSLVLAGPANMPLPRHPRVRALGFVDAATRDALLAHATALVMPSPFESLSIVLLEAWNWGVPALVNGRCAVLDGQVRRADGGLSYRTAAEFAAAAHYLLEHADVARTLGSQGRAYVDREYRWPIVLNRLDGFLRALTSSARPSSP